MLQYSIFNVVSQQTLSILRFESIPLTVHVCPNWSKWTFHCLIREKQHLKNRSDIDLNLTAINGYPYSRCHPIARVWSPNSIRPRNRNLVETDPFDVPTLILECTLTWWKISMRRITKVLLSSYRQPTDQRNTHTHTHTPTHAQNYLFSLQMSFRDGLPIYYPICLMNSSLPYICTGNFNYDTNTPRNYIVPNKKICMEQLSSSIICFKWNCNYLPITLPVHRYPDGVGGW